MRKFCWSIFSDSYQASDSFLIILIIYWLSLDDEARLSVQIPINFIFLFSGFPIHSFCYLSLFFLTICNLFSHYYMWEFFIYPWSLSFWCPWDFTGKNTGVSCDFLLQGTFPNHRSNWHLLHWQLGSLPLNHQRMNRYWYIIIYCAAAAAKSFKSCQTLCDPIDGSPPGSPVSGILQARTLEWVATAFSNA